MPGFTFVRALFALGLMLALSPVALVRGVTLLPADTVCFDSNRTGNFEIFTMKNDGTNQAQITNDRAYDSWWPRPSPDRTKILFVRTPAGLHDLDYTKVTTWVMNADGTELTNILPFRAHGWNIQGHPEWKPDGTRIVTLGTTSNSLEIYTINSDGTNPVRITSNGAGGPRGGINIDPSWRPDGQSLLFVGCPGSVCQPENYEVYRIEADGTGETRLTNDRVPDYDPYYSPDGGAIAWLRNTGGAFRWGVFKMAPDGANQTAVIDDGGINSKPDWSLDSSTIYFHRIPPGAPPGSLFNVWKILPNGTGLTEVILPRPAYINEYPANGINMARRLPSSRPPLQMRQPRVLITSEIMEEKP
ncbi:MAG: hypothetical protein ACREEM_00805 [Blastocatellia bacterium]